MNPEVSVLMSVHNDETYLRQAIDSILGQTFPDFEFIIIDDASTDQSLEILKQYAAQDDRIQLMINPDNLGLTKSLNKGLAVARGNYIARMDGDDIAAPSRLEIQKNFLDHNPNCVAVGSFVEFIDEDGDSLGVWKRPENHEDIDRTFMAGYGGVIVHPSAMLRTEALVKVGFYQEKYRVGQDYDLFLRLAEVGRLANIPQPLLQWRHHSKSTGYSKSQEQYQTLCAIRAETCQRRGIDAQKLASPPLFIRTSSLDVLTSLARFADSNNKRLTATKHAKNALKNLSVGSSDWFDMMDIVYGLGTIRFVRNLPKKAQYYLHRLFP